MKNVDKSTSKSQKDKLWLKEPTSCAMNILLKVRSSAHQNYNKSQELRDLQQQKKVQALIK